MPRLASDEALRHRTSEQAARVPTNAGLVRLFVGTHLLTLIDLHY
jgi:hypothetical protein